MLQSKTVTLTAAQLLNLTAAAVELVPGQPGVYLSLQNVILEYIAGSVAFTDTHHENLAVVLGTNFVTPPASDAIIAATPLLTTLGNMLWDALGAIATTTPIPAADYDDVGIYIGTQGEGDVTLGNGKLKVTVYYIAFKL